MKVLVVALSLMLAATGLAWAAFRIPAQIRAAPIVDAGQRIMRDETYTAAALAVLRTQAEAFQQSAGCDVDLRRAMAFIHFRSYGDATELADRAAQAEILRQLHFNARRLLGCSPHEPFIWFGLYWLQTEVSGFDETSFELLRRSYRYGRNEAWIMRKRAPLVLPVLASLPPDLRELAVDEYVDLIESGLVRRDVVIVFSMLSPQARVLVLERVGRLPDQRRTRFARMLRDAGFLDVEVPGVDRPPPRPWRN